MPNPTSGSKANLLLVVTKLELGGAQRNVLDLAAGLSRENFNVFLFTAREGMLMDEALSIPGIAVLRSRFLDRPLNPLKDLLAFLELYLFIRGRQIDIVHTHSSKAGLIGRFAAFLAGVRAVLHTVHGWSFHRRQPPALRAACVLAERLAAACTRGFIVVSAHDREAGLGRGIGARADYTRIPYGIDRGKFNLPQREKKGTAGPVVGTVACLKPQKAPRDFVRLASLIRRDFPDVQFKLAGDGMLRGEVCRMVRQSGLGNNVTLCGWRRDIPQFLASLDVFCLTSLWEGLPIAVIEAMAVSLPVVCTDTGGVRELIKHGENGFLVPPGDMEAMAAILAGLLRDGELRQRVGRRAAELPQDFSTGAMVERTARLYTDMLMTKGGV